MTVPDTGALTALEEDLAGMFEELALLQSRIRYRLISHADGKNLKGNELVGWLGEIYGKKLYSGTLVSDREEHDFTTDDGWKVSVKTRRGGNRGWNRSSAIPKVEGENCPTHLLFVHLDTNYCVARMWLFDWGELKATGRFQQHIVRGEPRSYIFSLREESDHKYLVYERPPRTAMADAVDQTARLLKSPRNAERLLAAVRELENDK
ncbi:hypothetical protein IYY11_17585 [Methylocystis sp. H62]|jgi:hypothetical protein|uniref:DUF6998 domain-containing protein n=1 Tax=Methylocystis sp. H62 TaxID=2785789 RepID=UPI0018C2286E|nr:hypothetical protein [Methylocystis sp. H62]MBG0795168.1 hypothetical protein [Methylocystis sp. H62]